MWEEYFQNNDIEKLAAALKEDTDEISCQYVDNFISNRKYWHKYISTKTKIWAPYDYKIMENSPKTFVQPYEELFRFDEFMFETVYGLKDVPDIFNRLNGKDIIDAGGFKGDTAYVFNKYFQNSNIFVYEPVHEYAEFIKKIKNKFLSDKVQLIEKGLSDEEKSVEIKSDYGETLQLTTLEKDYKGENLGLIKADIEGGETKLLIGARGLIEKYKPILAIAIYHSPEDFFNLKNKIKEINPSYKFMIRRSCFAIPAADLIVIAY